jgi:hypothetical protein
VKAKSLIDLYRKQLAQSPRKAPEGLWEDIAGKMDAMDEQQLIQLYTSQVGQSSEKAPEGLWENIARKMDIDEVWGNVAAGLEKRGRAGRYRWLASRVAAAAAFLLMATLSVWIANNWLSPKAELADAETETIDPGTSADPREPATGISGEAPAPEIRIAASGRNEDVRTTGSEEEKAVLASFPEQDKTAGGESILLETTPDGFFLENLLPAQPAGGFGAMLEMGGMPTIVEKTPLHLYASTEASSDFGDIVSGEDPGVLSLGVSTAMKNTWLFNHETFQGFSPGSGIATQMQIYPDIAINLRYRASHKWALQSNMSFSSNAGQRYEQFIFGRYSQRSIALNYFHGEVLAGYRHNQRWVVRTRTIFHSTTLGFYYGRLNAASETIAGEREDVSALYRKEDYGLIAGHNLDIPLSGRMMFSPGLYITWGLPNIYKGAYTLPALKRTHNRSIELRLSLYYNLTR